MRISDWSSDACSSDLTPLEADLSGAGLDPADLDGAVVLCAEDVESPVRLRGVDDHDHAAAEVEHLAHLGVGDVADLRDLTEDARRLPASRAGAAGGALGHHPAQVPPHPTAPDVHPPHPAP